MKNSLKLMKHFHYLHHCSQLYSNSLEPLQHYRGHYLQYLHVSWRKIKSLTLHLSHNALVIKGYFIWFSYSQHDLYKKCVCVGRGEEGEGERGHACPGTHTLSIGGLVANTFLYNATHLEDHNYFSALVQ